MQSQCRGVQVPGKSFRISVSQFDRFLECLVVWIVACSGIGLASALAHHFYAPQVLLLATMVTVLYAWKTRGRVISREGSVNGYVILSLLLVALFFRLPAFDYVLGGQDDGVYMNMAQHIDATGGIAVRDKPLEKIAGSPFESTYLAQNRKVVPATGSHHTKNVGQYVAGVYVKSRSGAKLQFQFYHLFSTFMAVVGGVFGASMAVYGLTLFSILSIFLAFRLTLLLTDSELAAAAAALLLAVNPLHVFFSKLPVTAIVAQAFSLAGFYFLALTWKTVEKHSQRAWLAISALCFGGIFFTRVTGFLYVPFVVGLALLFALYTKGRPPHRSVQYWALGVVALYVLSIGYGFHWSTIYVSDIYTVIASTIFHGHLRAGIVVICALVAMVWLTLLIAVRLPRAAQVTRVLVDIARKLVVPTLFVGTLLGIYKIYLLGWTEKYRDSGFMFDSRWGIVHSHWKSLPASSLGTLFVYLGPLVVPMFLWLAVRRQRTAATEFLRLYAVAFFLYALLVMWVIPYGPFPARYLLTAVVPSLLLYVIVAWSTNTAGNERWFLGVGIAVSIAYMTITSFYQVGKVETHGLRSSIAALVAPVDKGDVILLDSLDHDLPNDSEMKTPLVYGHGLNVISVNAQSLGNENYLRFLANIYKDVYLLSPKKQAPTGFAYDGSRQIVVWAFANTHGFPSHLIPREKMNLYRFRLKSLPVPLGIELPFNAGSSMLNWLDTGWSFPEQWGVWSVAHQAYLMVPVTELAMGGHGVKLTLKLRAFVSKTYPRQRVEVSVDGEIVAKAVFQYPQTDRSLEIAVDSKRVEADSQMRIGLLLPDATSPRSLHMSNDPRVLGVGLESVKVDPLQ